MESSVIYMYVHSNLYIIVFQAEIETKIQIQPFLCHKGYLDYPKIIMFVFII